MCEIGSSCFKFSHLKRFEEKQLNVRFVRGILCEGWGLDSDRSLAQQREQNPFGEIFSLCLGIS